MPRKARVDAPGALHHLIVRGIEHRRIFSDDQDRDNFIKRLGAVITETETFCFAWALIPNHLHLLLRTGKTSLSTVMRRLLLLELVRYIHLNPLRAKLVEDLKDLDKYPYSGHSAIMAKKQRDFQDVDYVLKFFGKKATAARKAYRVFLHKGITQGRRPDLVGGGLVRSAGGWSVLKAMRRAQVRIKGDERILGDGDFTQSVLDSAKEQVEQRYRLKAQGYDLDKVALRVSNVLEMEQAQIWAPGKHPKTVKARSLLCYWAVRQLGFSATELSKRLGISQPSVSISVKRGEAIAKSEHFNLVED
jgi:REP element-mobilizing transposase RayT